MCAAAEPRPHSWSTQEEEGEGRQFFYPSDTPTAASASRSTAFLEKTRGTEDEWKGDRSRINRRRRRRAYKTGIDTLPLSAGRLQLTSRQRCGQADADHGHARVQHQCVLSECVCLKLLLEKRVRRSFLFLGRQRGSKTKGNLSGRLPPLLSAPPRARHQRRRRRRRRRGSRRRRIKLATTAAAAAEMRYSPCLSRAWTSV